MIHFACHGYANLVEPLSNALILAEGERLTLKDLLDTALSHVRIVVLSACDTAVLDTAVPEEVISFPTGLLEAGAAAVIASLWPVLDLSTMLLMARFYTNWRLSNMKPAEACSPHTSGFAIRLRGRSLSL